MPKERQIVFSDGSGGTYVWPIDGMSNSLRVIDYEHHEIHGGSSFAVWFDNTTANSDDDRSVIAFKTAAGTKLCHITMSVTASNPAEAIILEAPSTIDLNEGTGATVFNRYRGSGTASTVLSLTNPGVAGKVTTFTEAQIAGAQLTGGTVIDHVSLAGGEGPKAVGGVSRGSQEWILAANTTYLFYLQNIGQSANLHHINLDWYEHTNS